MWRAKIHNRAFDRMGEGFAPLIDRDHFLGHSAFDIKRHDDQQPAANLTKKGNEFVLELAVPGYAKEELEILVENDILKVRGQKNQEEKRENPKYILEEVDFESFERCFKLSPRIVHDKLKASYKEGVLRLEFSETETKPQKNYYKVNIG